MTSDESVGPFRTPEQEAAEEWERMARGSESLLRTSNLDLIRELRDWTDGAMACAPAEKHRHLGYLAADEIERLQREVEEYAHAPERWPRPAGETSVGIRELFNKGVGAQKGRHFSFGFETEEEANRAFHYLADLGSLETSQPPRQKPARRAPPELREVPVHTLSRTHICDGEEVVSGGEDGQTWIATFADSRMAAYFVNVAKVNLTVAWGDAPGSAVKASGEPNG